MDDEDLLQAITIAWDLDGGTGISVRYGDMRPMRAAHLLHLAAELVREHADLLDEIDDDVETDEYVDDDEWDDDDDGDADDD